MTTLEQKLWKLVKNPWTAYSYLSAKGFTSWMPDTVHLKIIFRASLGHWPDLEHPMTFNEKMQWLKIHDRNPLYTTLVDKYAVKSWVAERIGEQYVVPTYARWDRAEDIDILGLPDHFVLKTNHDCGGIVICRDRATFNLGAAKKKLAKHLKRSYYWGCREWPYKDVKPCVFAEEYLESIQWEYQAWTVDGDIKTIAAILEPHGVNKKRFYNSEWIEEPFVSSIPKLDKPVTKPAELGEILDLSSQLSSGLPFARVDFLKAKDTPIKLGEITLYPAGGFVRWQPPEWDERLGTWIYMSGGVLHSSRLDCFCVPSECIGFAQFEPARNGGLQVLLFQRGAEDALRVAGIGRSRYCPHKFPYSGLGIRTVRQTGLRPLRKTPTTSDVPRGDDWHRAYAVRRHTLRSRGPVRAPWEAPLQRDDLQPVRRFHAIRAEGVGQGARQLAGATECAALVSRRIEKRSFPRRQGRNGCGLGCGAFAQYPIRWEGGELCR